MTLVLNLQLELLLKNLINFDSISNVIELTYTYDAPIIDFLNYITMLVHRRVLLLLNYTKYAY